MFHVNFQSQLRNNNVLQVILDRRIFGQQQNNLLSNLHFVYTKIYIIGQNIQAFLNIIYLKFHINFSDKNRKLEIILLY